MSTYAGAAGHQRRQLRSSARRRQFVHAAPQSTSGSRPLAHQLGEHPTGAGALTTNLCKRALADFEAEAYRNEIAGDPGGPAVA